MKIKFLKNYTVQDAAGTEYQKDKTYDLDDRSAKHFLNRRLAEEVQSDKDKKAESQPQPVDAEPELTAAEVRKMKRAELDELAATKEIDLGNFNVDDSKDYLIHELGLTDKEPA